MPSDGLPCILSPVFLNLNPWAGTALLDLVGNFRSLNPLCQMLKQAKLALCMPRSPTSSFPLLQLGLNTCFSLGWALLGVSAEEAAGYLASYSAWRAWTGAWSFPKVQRLSFWRGVCPMPHTKHRQTRAGCRWERASYSGAQSIAWLLRLTGNSS